MKQHWRKIVIIFGLMITAFVANNVSQSFHNDNFLHSLERFAYDMRVNMSARDNPDSRIVVIDIDEKSLLEIGRWPWSRVKHAELVDALFTDYQLETLGFDIVFSESEDQFSREEVKKMLLDGVIKKEQDQVLAEQFEGRNIVLGYVFQLVGSGQYKTKSVGVLPAHSELDIYSDPLSNRFTANLPSLQAAANNQGGFFSLGGTEDVDGIIRRTALFNELDGKTYSSLPLSLVENYLGQKAQESADSSDFSESIILGDKVIGLGLDSDVYVPYTEKGTMHETVSAADILSGSYEGDLNNKIAILGTSAAGLLDLRNTPITQSFPGVHVHANIMDGLLNNSFVTKTWDTVLIDIAMVIVIGLLLSCLLPFLGLAKSSMVYLFSIIALLVLNMVAWQDKVLLSIAPILFLVTLLFALNALITFFRESSAKKQLNQLFGLYVPPEIISDLAANQDSQELLATQKREMTVMFLDIRDFTTISESMDPESVSAFLSYFFTEMTRIVHKHGGAVDKYMGDSLMAFWGAPVDDEDHAEHAISASLEMLSLQEAISDEFILRGWQPIQYSIGVNSGLVSVGNMGSEFRMAYTVVGDAVNLGSRLEGLTREYDVNLIVSEFSKQLAQDFSYTELAEVKVKGKTESVRIFTCD